LKAFDGVPRRRSFGKQEIFFSGSNCLKADSIISSPATGDEDASDDQKSSKGQKLNSETESGIWQNTRSGNSPAQLEH